MARVTAEEYADKHARRLKGATEDIRRGIERVSEAPGKKAAAAQSRMMENLMASIQDGTWAAQVSKVSLQEWKDSAIGKGIGRIAAGIDAAQPKQVAMAQKLLAAVDATLTEVNRTPRGDLETNIARSANWARGMNKRKLRRPGA